MVASAHIANLVSQIAEIRNAPLEMRGGIGAFCCDGLEFGLEVSDKADAILLNVAILQNADALPSEILREALQRNLEPDLLFSAGYGISARANALVLYGGTAASSLDEPELWAVLQRFVELALSERDYFGTWDAGAAVPARPKDAGTTADAAAWTRV